MPVAALVVALLSPCVTVIAFLFARTQWRHEFKAKLDSIYDEVTKELVRQRVEPYAAFMSELEVFSRTHEEELRSDRNRVRDLSGVFQKAIYGQVGILASNFTREIIVAARAGCLNYADRKATFDILLSRVWGIHQALRSDLGLSQPNWPDETEARRRGLLAADSETIDKQLRDAVHLGFSLYDETVPTISLDNGQVCRAIIFDMDGLLLDSEIVERRAWQRAANERGCSITDDDFGQLVGRTAEDTKRILEQLWLEKGENPAEYNSVRTLKEDYADEEAVLPKIGAADILKWACRVRMPVAVASSTSRAKVIERLAKAGLLGDRLDVIVGGEEVDRGKPYPDIFEVAAKRLSIGVEMCLVLEDSPSGVKAAREAGMETILVPDKSVQTSEPDAAIVAMAFTKCDTLSDVLGLLRSRMTFQVLQE